MIIVIAFAVTAAALIVSLAAALDQLAARINRRPRLPRARVVRR